MKCPGCGKPLSEEAERKLGACFHCMDLSADERADLRRAVRAENLHERRSA
jgi:hypothetical protein